MRIAGASLLIMIFLASPVSPDASAPARWTREDREAARLVEELDGSRGPRRSEIVERILERRLPQTVPALSVLLPEKELRAIHYRFCEGFHYTGILDPSDSFRTDPFEAAICMAVCSVPGHEYGLKQRG